MCVAKGILLCFLMHPPSLPVSFLRPSHPALQFRKLDNDLKLKKNHFTIIKGSLKPQKKSNHLRQRSGARKFQED